MNADLAPLFSYTSSYHVGFAHILLACALVYLAITQLLVRAKNYSLYIRYYLPFYHTIIACAIFTGIIMLAAFEFKFSHKSGIMALVSVLLIASSAIGYGRLKRHLRANDRHRFRRFALIKGLIDIALIIIAAKV